MKINFKYFFWLVFLFILTGQTSGQPMQGIYVCKLKFEEVGNFIYRDNGEKHFTIKISEKGTVNISLDVEVREAKTQTTNHILVTSSASGSLNDDGGFSASGPFTISIFERGEMDTQWNLSAVYAGKTETVAGISSVSGSIKVKQENEGEVAFTFTGALQADPGLKLLFPLGESPKVLDKGWKFGASAIVETPEGLADMSDKIEWSGSADFTPVMGRESSPVFHKPGQNKIRLTVKLPDGNELAEEFEIEVVDSKLYATVGCYVICPADAHGCPACPHPVVGAISLGEPDVLINGLQVITAPLTGTQMGCCGPNTFSVMSGDREVLLHGKPLIPLGTVSDHCGGKGTVVRLPERLFPILSFNHDVTVMLKVIGTFTGKELADLKGSNDGSTFITGTEGAVTIGLGPGQILSAGPETKFKVDKEPSGRIVVKVTKGHIRYAGHTAGTGTLIINLEKESIVPVGTHFTAEVLPGRTLLTLLEGKIDYRFLSTGETLTLVAGEKIETNTASVVSRTAADPRMVEQIWSGFATKGGKLTLADFTGDASVPGKWYTNIFKVPSIYIVGGVVASVLVLIFILIIRKRRKRKRLSVVSKPESDVRKIINPAVTPRQVAETSPKYCPFCGNPLKPDVRFCGKCGNRIQQN